MILDDKDGKTLVIDDWDLVNIGRRPHVPKSIRYFRRPRR